MYSARHIVSIEYMLYGQDNVDYIKLGPANESNSYFFLSYNNIK